MSDKHTALPWRAEVQNWDGDKIFHILSADDKLPYSVADTIGCLPDGMEESNAQLIVKAVNNHAKLVEALRAVVVIAEFRECMDPDVVKARTLLQQLGEME